MKRDAGQDDGMDLAGPRTGMPPTTHGSSAVRPRRRGGIRAALALWLLFCGVLGAWALASPQYASPDEPAHVFRAAAVVRGEILPHAGDSVSGGTGMLMVPEGFAINSDRAVCNAMHSHMSADCFHPVPADDDLIERPSGAAKYNPVYYLLVGGPSLLDTGTIGFYGMRLASLMVCSAFLTSAVLSAWRGRNARLWTTGTLLSMTPMVFFMSSVVNPNGLEIAASVALWAALLRVVTGTASRAEHPRLARAIGLSASAIVITRQLSPLWVAIIALLSLAVAEKEPLLAFLRSKITWLWAAVFAAASGFALWWTVSAGTGSIPDISQNEDMSTIGAISWQWNQAGDRFRDLVGNFGWLDSPASPLAVISYWIIFGTLITLAFVVGRRRHRIVLLVAIATTILLPLYLEATQFNLLGLFWQARYTLPLFVGLIPLSVVAIDLSPLSLPAEAVRRGCGVLLFIWVAIQTASMASLLIRQRSGLPYTMNPFEGTWSPPGGSLVALALVAFGCGALTWFASRYVRDEHAACFPADPGPAPDAAEPNQTTVTVVQAKSGLPS